LGELLVSGESTERYYWEPVTPVISAVFELAVSPAFREALPLGQLIGPVLAKLPVRGDYREAQFIYETLLVMVVNMQEVMEPHLSELFRVVTETLASRNRYFARTKLKDETRLGLVRVFQDLAGRLPNCAEVVGQILNGDAVKLATLQARISG
jgi:hypothetical protein